MLLNNNNEIFVGKRHLAYNNSYVWQLPQGGIEDGESPEEALKREAKEEIGTSDFAIIQETDSWLHYDLPKNLQKTFRHKIINLNKKQKQKNTD